MVLLEDLLAEFCRSFVCARDGVLQLEEGDIPASAATSYDVSETASTHLLNPDIHLPYSLPSCMYIIRAAQLIHLIP